MSWYSLCCPIRGNIARDDPCCTVVNLNGQALGFEGTLALAQALFTNTHVVVLFLNHCQLPAGSSRAWQTLCLALAQHPTLEYLYMSYNPNVGDIGLATLAQAFLVQKKTNHVDQTQVVVTTEGSSRNNNTTGTITTKRRCGLKAWKATHCQVGDLACQALAQWLTLSTKPSCTTPIATTGKNNTETKSPTNRSSSDTTNGLETLDLQSNQIGPKGFLVLAQALQHVSTLKSLDLRFNEPLEAAAARTATSTVHTAGRARQRGLHDHQQEQPEHPQTPSSVSSCFHCCSYRSGSLPAASNNDSSQNEFSSCRRRRVSYLPNPPRLPNPDVRNWNVLCQAWHALALALAPEYGNNTNLQCVQVLVEDKILVVHDEEEEDDEEPPNRHLIMDNHSGEQPTTQQLPVREADSDGDVRMVDMTRNTVPTTATTTTTKPKFTTCHSVVCPNRQMVDLYVTLNRLGRRHFYHSAQSSNLVPSWAWTFLLAKAAQRTRTGEEGPPSSSHIYNQIIIPQERPSRPSWSSLLQSSSPSLTTATNTNTTSTSTSILYYLIRFRPDLLITNHPRPNTTTAATASTSTTTPLAFSVMGMNINNSSEHDDNDKEEDNDDEEEAFLFYEDDETELPPQQQQQQQQHDMSGIWMSTTTTTTTATMLPDTTAFGAAANSAILHNTASTNHSRTPFPQQHVTASETTGHHWRTPQHSQPQPFAVPSPAGQNERAVPSYHPRPVTPTHDLDHS